MNLVTFAIVFFFLHSSHYERLVEARYFNVSIIPHMGKVYNESEFPKVDSTASEMQRNLLAAKDRCSKSKVDGTIPLVCRSGGPSIWIIFFAGFFSLMTGVAYGLYVFDDGAKETNNFADVVQVQIPDIIPLEPRQQESRA